MATTSWNPSYPLPKTRPALPRWPALFTAWLPVFAFLSLFAIESTATFGADHTSAPLHSLSQSIFGPAVNHNWSQLHHIIRKSGHFFGYGIFSLVCFRAFRLTLPRRLSVDRHTTSVLSRPAVSQLLGIAATAVVASLDELHQSFLPNRTGCVADVLLDTSGAVSLQVILFLVLNILQARRSPRPYAGYCSSTGRVPSIA